MPTTSEEDFIKLSVQGAFFVLKKSMVLSHDWILAKIVTSDIPWDKTSNDGQIFVDVDQTSFRVILSLLSGGLDLKGDSNHFSVIDLTLLLSTARYLMLGEKLIEEIEGLLNNAETTIKELKEIRDQYYCLEDMLLTKLKCKENKLRTKIEEVMKIKEKWDLLQNALVGNDRKVYQCNGYRTHRSCNRCGCKSIIIGPLIFDDDDNLVCAECESTEVNQCWNMNAYDPRDENRIIEEILSLPQTNEL